MATDNYVDRKDHNFIAAIKFVVLFANKFEYVIFPLENNQNAQFVCTFVLICCRWR